MRFSFRADQSERLHKLLETAPAPTVWGWKTYPRIPGPEGRTLVWKEGAHYVVKLVDEQDETMCYLGLGFYCYVRYLGANNLIVWYHIGPTGSPIALRIHLFESTSLNSIQKMPIYNNLNHSDESQISYNCKNHTSVDLPTNMTRGTHPLEFPVEFKRTVDRLAVLVHGTDKPRPKFQLYNFPGESAYSLIPSENKIRVTPLDWWNDGDHDFGYLWVGRVALDPETGNVVGDGKGVLPFMMDGRSGKVRFLKK